MRPTFGSRIHELVFAPNDASTATLAKRYIESALAMWEPRIQVTSVEVSNDPANSECLLIHLGYVIKAVNDQRSLVFPFYRIPGE